MVVLGFPGQVPEKDHTKLDPQGILNTFYELMHDAPTAKGVINSNLGAHPHRTEFKIMRPNLFSMVSSEFEVRGDGKNLYVQTKGRKDAMHFHQTAGAPDIYGFEPLTSDERPAYVRAGNLKPGLFRGKDAYLIPIADDRSKAGAVTLYIDQKTLLPIACEFSSKGKSSFLAYEDVELGAKMSRSDFVWAPARKS